MKAQILVLFLVNFALGQFVDDDCEHRDTNGKGKCKFSEDCPSASANGNKPQLCAIIRRKQVICCPEISQGRISAQKCEQYGAVFKSTLHYGTLTFQSQIHSLNTINCIHRNDAESLIVGGTATKHGEFPHMAAIGWKNDLDNSVDYRCGGSLISEHYVLTAAHCLQLRKRKPNVVKLGDQNLKYEGDDSNVQVFDVKRSIKHESYRKKSRYYDIGLVELDGTVKFTNYVYPACLPQYNEIHDGKSVIATGWGVLEYKGEHPDQLQKVTLHVLNNQRCNEYFSEDELENGIEDSQLCAAYLVNGELVGGKDTCQGDSGGPLQIKKPDNGCQYEIVGITSFSSVGCANEESPGVYTRVNNYLDWIEPIVWN